MVAGVGGVASRASPVQARQVLRYEMIEALFAVDALVACAA
jgi:hypothetical protein